MKYTLSFYTKENQPKIEYPKYFEFWKRAKLVDNKIWIRKVVLIDENNSEAIDIFNSKVLREIIKQTHPEAEYLQLELGEDVNTNYIRL
jgi:hypothetical protein